MLISGVFTAFTPEEIFTPFTLPVMVLPVTKISLMLKRKYKAASPADSHPVMVLSVTFTLLVLIYTPTSDPA